MSFLAPNLSPAFCLCESEKNRPIQSIQIENFALNFSIPNSNLKLNQSEIMNESVSHLKYEKYKRLVKLWERDFKQKTGRTPSKVKKYKFTINKKKKV